MARFDLLFEQTFTNTNSITLTHNLNRYVFNVRLVISGDPRLSQRELVQDVLLDQSDPLNKCTVSLIGSYSGVVQIIAEDTIQSPYYTVEEKLASQIQTELAGTFPIKFEYGGKSNAGRVLEFASFDDSQNSPYTVVGDGNIRAVSFRNSATGTGTIGVYKIASPTDILLYTLTYTAVSSKIDKPLDIEVFDGDEIYVKQDTGASKKPVVVVYFQTI